MNLNKKTAMKIGAIGGALAALPSYLVAGDPVAVITNMDLMLFAGVLVRAVIFSGLGALYAYMVPLPADRWTAMERGIVAPGLIAALMFAQSPPANEIDKLLENSGPAISFEIISSAHANHTAGHPKPKPGSVRQFIKGLLGK